MNAKLQTIPCRGMGMVEASELLLQQLHSENQERNLFAKLIKPVTYNLKLLQHTHTHTHNRFMALLDFAQDCPGEPVPER